VLRSERGRVACELERAHLAALGPVPEVESLADFLVALCATHDARMLLIDGPQAWKDEANGLPCQRLCEKELATQAKTGPPGRVKPATQASFARLSVALFDRLGTRGFARFDQARPADRLALEIWPTACWRAFGVKALPGKRSASDDDVARRAALLVERFCLSFRQDPNHDELQAAVAGLAGIALEGHPALAWRAHGSAPFQLGGAWREGVIVVPVPANSSR
jgi:Protein of unknown function (DUF429)